MEKRFSTLAMDHPIRLLLLPLNAIWIVAAAAQPAAPTSVKPNSDADAAPARAARVVSARVAEMLAEGRPKYQPPTASEKSSGPTERSDRSSETPANSIVRLPSYVVREPKLPTPIEVMTRHELENYAMKRYIGPEDGLDRGVLNLFTFAGLLKKVPVLGRFPFVGSETNEDRAVRLHDAAERKRKMEELGGLMRLSREVGDAAGADKIKQELDKASIRPTETGR